jgi:branched-subunit amino acid ABC-type transport system permease component
MFELLGITPQGLVAQLLVGLINGSFYAILSLGLAIIFGLLNIINFAHGAQYTMGAFVAWIGLTQISQWLGFPDLSINYWFALIIVPLVLAGFGLILERTMLRRLYHLDHLYGLLLTFGLALIIEGMFRHWYGSPGAVTRRHSAGIYWHYFAEISYVGSCYFFSGLLLYLVCNRENKIGRLFTRWNRKPKTTSSFWH